MHNNSPYSQQCCCCCIAYPCNEQAAGDKTHEIITYMHDKKQTHPENTALHEHARREIVYCSEPSETFHNSAIQKQFLVRIFWNDSTSIPFCTDSGQRDTSIIDQNMKQVGTIIYQVETKANQNLMVKQANNSRTKTAEVNEACQYQQLCHNRSCCQHDKLSSTQQYVLGQLLAVMTFSCDDL